MNHSEIKTGKFIVRLLSGDLAFCDCMTLTKDSIRLHSPRLFIRTRARAMRPKYIDVRRENLIWLGEESEGMDD